MKKNNVIILAIVLSIPFFIALKNGNISKKTISKSTWIATTDKSRWNERFSVAVVPATPDIDIEVLVDKKAQEIDGFGGCFNEKGWEALSNLMPDKRELILSELFNQENGCKFNICRMPIGASDYAIEWYSLNETPGDFEMKNFNIDRDKKYLIPYIQAAKKINPDLKIWASPWSPPSWMKRNNNYACKQSKYNKYNGLESKEGENMFDINDKNLDAYALYFSKFIQAYKNEGIDIFMVQPQNECHSATIYPGCTWTASALGEFIRHLGPRFEQDNLNTEIWFGTMERPYIAEIDTILKNPATAKYVKGLGFQWGGRPVVLEVNAKYPAMRKMQTESQCGDGSNDWKAAVETWNLMKSYFSSGVNSYMYWNMILDDSGNSAWGWKQNAMISVFTKTKDIQFNVEFYLMKHFSYFIRKGAHRVQLSKINDNILAFENPDGQIVLVICNNTDKDRVMKIKIGDQMITPKISSQSFNTIALNL